MQLSGTMWWFVLVVVVVLVRGNKASVITDLETLINNLKSKSYDDGNSKKDDFSSKTVSTRGLDSAVKTSQQRQQSEDSSAISIRDLLKAFRGLSQTNSQEQEQQQQPAKKSTNDEESPPPRKSKGITTTTTQTRGIPTPFKTQRLVESPPPRRKITGEMEAVAPETIANNKHRQCGLNSRLRYRKCLIETNYKDNYKCAEEFVREYPVCFFPQLPPSTQSSPHRCPSTCLSHFDQCMFFSTKPESMVCLRARKHCSAGCPSGSGVRVKRDCYGVCAGYFIICEQVVQQYEDLYICKENEQACRRACDQD